MNEEEMMEASVEVNMTMMLEMHKAHLSLVHGMNEHEIENELQLIKGAMLKKAMQKMTEALKQKGMI